jgi:ribokinase
MKSLHFGSATIDVITLIDSDDIERATLSNEGTSFLMLEAGRKLPARSITTHVGGGACNTAVSLSRRGWDTAVIAKVGDDHNAGAVRGHLSQNNIEDRLIVSEQATGTAVMIASHDRNASILVHRGANEHLSKLDLPDMSGHDLVYVAPLSSGSADCFPEIVTRAKAAGATVAVNPGIRQLTSRLEPFLGALATIDLLSVNRAEAEALVPVLYPDAPPQEVTPQRAPKLMQRGLRSAALRMDVSSFLRALQAAGPKWVSLTDGTEGAYLAGPDSIVWHPTLPAKVAGTAGAGDSFCSTLTAALIEGQEPSVAMRQAALNAASVVSHVDTTTGLLTREKMKTEDARATPSPVMVLG